MFTPRGLVDLLLSSGICYYFQMIFSKKNQNLQFQKKITTPNLKTTIKKTSKSIPTRKEKTTSTSKITMKQKSTDRSKTKSTNSKSTKVHEQEKEITPVHSGAPQGLATPAAIPTRPGT